MTVGSELIEILQFKRQERLRVVVHQRLQVPEVDCNTDGKELSASDSVPDLDLVARDSGSRSCVALSVCSFPIS